MNDNIRYLSLGMNEKRAVQSLLHAHKLVEIMKRKSLTSVVRGPDFIYAFIIPLSAP